MKSDPFHDHFSKFWTPAPINKNHLFQKNLHFDIKTIYSFKMDVKFELPVKKVSFWLGRLYFSTKFYCTAVEIFKCCSDINYKDNNYKLFESMKRYPRDPIQIKLTNKFKITLFKNKKAGEGF